MAGKILNFGSLNIDYVYAIGDVCVGLKQWIVACGEGAVAATSAFEDIQ